MTTIYRLSFVLLIFLMGVNVLAQDSPLTLGVKAGVNLSNMAGDINDSDSKVGFQFGVTADYAINSTFSLITGLEFTTKGLKYKEIYEEDYYYNTREISVTLNPIYLQIPIHAAYKIDIVPNTKIVFQAGPYVAYGIAGKATVEERYVSEKVNVFSTGGLREFDFGLGLGAGVEYGQIVAKIGYDFGVINIGDSGEGKLKNRNAFLTLGYNFDSSKF